jgi:alpha-L-fucosidase 2
MLLQSHRGVIRLLPALPSAWPSGSFRGLRARGGVEVDCKWRDGKASEAVLRTSLDGTIRLAVPKGQRVIKITQNGRPVALQVSADGIATEIVTKAKQSYQVTIA